MLTFYIALSLHYRNWTFPFLQNPVAEVYPHHKFSPAFATKHLSELTNTWSELYTLAIANFDFLKNFHIF